MKIHTNNLKIKIHTNNFKIKIQTIPKSRSTQTISKPSTPSESKKERPKQRQILQNNIRFQQGKQNLPVTSASKAILRYITRFSCTHRHPCIVRRGQTSFATATSQRLQWSICLGCTCVTSSLGIRRKSSIAYIEECCFEIFVPPLRHVGV